MKQSNRKQRLSELMRSSGGSTASHEFLEGAFLLLRYALNERPQVYKTKETHFSRFATSAIILFTTGFEAWLNEQIVFVVFTKRKNIEFLELANEYGFFEKYKRLCKLAKISSKINKDDLKLLNIIRNEAVHFYPRDVSNSSYIDKLKEKKVLFDQKVLGDYGLNNYATAYWVALTIQYLTQKLGYSLSQLKGKFMPIINYSSNFTIPQDILAPNKLQRNDNI